MKQVIFSNWNLVRVLRLIMGIAITVQAVMMKDVLFGATGFLFTIMPLFNMGCAAGDCMAPPAREKTVTKEIVYEEVV